jgi:hypothetical protein
MGWRTWSLRFREELKVFESRVKIDERESQNVTGDWRKLRNKEYNALVLFTIKFHISTWPYHSWLSVRRRSSFRYIDALVKTLSYTLQSPQAGRVGTRSDVSASSAATTSGGGRRFPSFQESESKGHGSAGGAHSQAIRSGTARRCRWVGSGWMLSSYRKQNVCMQSFPLTVTATQQIHRADFHVISSCILFIYSFICLFIPLLIHSHGHPHYYYYYYFVITSVRVFTIIYLKQTMSVGYIVLQLLSTYNLCYM